MFKRRRKGNKNDIEVIKKKGNWFQRIFKKKPKTIVATPKTEQAQNKSSLKRSVETIFRNKVKKSKINVKDIELIDGMDANDLKKRFSVSGSKAKILEGMVADYKRGRLSLPGISHKSKFDGKSLDKTRLNKMIKEYDEVKRKKDFEEAQKNANDLKKKFSLTKSQANKLDKVVGELNKGKGSKLHLAKTLLDPKKLTKERVQKLVNQYDEAQKKKRGLSYMMTKSNLSFVVSKQKMQNLMEDVKEMGLSKILKKH